MPFHSWTQEIDIALITVEISRRQGPLADADTATVRRHSPGIFEILGNLTCHDRYLVDVKLFGVSIEESPFEFIVTLGLLYVFLFSPLSLRSLIFLAVSLLNSCTGKNSPFEEKKREYETKLREMRGRQRQDTREVHLSRYNLLEDAFNKFSRMPRADMMGNLRVKSIRWWLLEREQRCSQCDPYVS